MITSSYIFSGFPKISTCLLCTWTMLKSIKTRQEGFWPISNLLDVPIVQQDRQSLLTFCYYRLQFREIERKILEEFDDDEVDVVCILFTILSC